MVPPDFGLFEEDRTNQPSDDELNRVVAREALIGLMAVARRPTRHAMAKTSALREAIAYTKAKPAQANTLSAPDGGPVQSEHRIIFVKPGETA